LTTDKIMSKRTKLILSIIGVSAIIIPVVLLIVFTQNTGTQPEIPSGQRTIDVGNIEKAVKNAPKKESVFPTASPSTPSAKPISEGSPSAE